MFSTVKSIALNGLEGYLVNVQVDVSAGLPSWEIVGLPDASVKEAKERVKTSIKNSNFNLESRKITINLAPANLKKEGTSFDLPMAVGLLYNFGYIESNLENVAIVGELSLDGTVGKVKGILPICIEAKKLGINQIIIPYENKDEGSIVSGINTIAVKNLKEVVDYLNGNLKIKNYNIDVKKILNNSDNFYGDFSEVKGHKNVKRAIEVAVTGAHGICMIGSPGSGKTMLVQRIPSILPKLRFEEALEITKIYSILGKLEKEMPLITQRPFRNVHYSVTPVSLIGGGKSPIPGEISLAHLGVLFLDELPEFNKQTLELLRTPLEEGKISISRINSSVTFPSKFMFVASMNPCPCGYYGAEERTCTCSPNKIAKYMNKISGPLLDRIDIQIEVKQTPYKNLKSSIPEESSEIIRKRVNAARDIQKERYKKAGIYTNSELTPSLIEEFCKLDKESEEILEKAFDKLGLSSRAYSRILKVARTIADLEESTNIKSKHIAEAIQYRNLDRKYWKN